MMRSWGKSVSIICVAAASLCMGFCSAAESADLRVVYAFKGGADGGQPASVIRDAAGNLYGTTTQGGTHDLGAVFVIAPDGTERRIRSWPGGDRRGLTPTERLALDSHGNLYGMTPFGGRYGFGTVFKVTPDGQLTTLHSFDGTDGAFPEAGVTIDSHDNLYGATPGLFNYGTIFEIQPILASSHSHKFKVLHTFSNLDNGGYSSGALILDGQGNLYGQTQLGGEFGAGVVFQLTRGGALTVLHSFYGNGGEYPAGSLTMDTQGNLYGTTAQGGQYSYGTVFKLAADGEFSVLYSFAGADGGYPSGNLIRDESGNLYGTTSEGGDHLAGEVFKVSPDGSMSIVHAFTGGSDGGSPGSNLASDGASLFGTASQGGEHRSGLVFSVPLGAH